MCFVLIPAMAYLATFVPLYGLSIPDILEAQRRIFATTPRPRSPATPI